MKMHFISGLPRSGSTLLCALLRQNPRFHAAMTSPLNSLCATMLNKMSAASQFSAFYTDEIRRQLLQGLFSSYYAGATDRIVFDTNRIWTGRMSLLADIYPTARVICCVRDIGWIIDSTERMLRKNPLQVSRLFNYEPGQSVYARAEVLMHSDNGLIGQAWSCLREAWFSEHASRLLLIDYKKLAGSPAETMQRFYAAIGEATFDHDFENVVYDETEYDAALGMPGMHTVRKKVTYQDRMPCIPPDLIAKHADLSFWTRPELNRGRGEVWADQRGIGQRAAEITKKSQ